MKETPQPKLDITDIHEMATGVVLTEDQMFDLCKLPVTYTGKGNRYMSKQARQFQTEHPFKLPDECRGEVKGF